MEIVELIFAFVGVVVFLTGVGLVRVLDQD